MSTAILFGFVALWIVAAVGFLTAAIVASGAREDAFRAGYRAGYMVAEAEIGANWRNLATRERERADLLEETVRADGISYVEAVDE